MALVPLLTQLVWSRIPPYPSDRMGTTELLRPAYYLLDLHPLFFFTTVLTGKEMRSVLSDRDGTHNHLPQTRGESRWEGPDTGRTSDEVCMS